MDLVVTEDRAAHRFELNRGDEQLGHADYTVDGDAVVITHVQTAPRHRGNGFAAELMAGLLEQLRDSDRTVVPVCSHAVAYLGVNPDQHDLLA